jgi:hypothetical protein
LVRNPSLCVREDGCVEFAMRYDRWYRPLATALGMGPKRTVIRVDGETLHVKHGWAFRLDIPLSDIASASKPSMRPLSWGVHSGGDMWMVNASRDGLVELKLAKPVTSKSVKLQSSSWGEVRTLYLSLEDPDGFVAAVNPNA